MRATSTDAIRWSAPRSPIFRLPLAEELGIEEEGPGVVVLDVEPNTPASRLGVKRGDLVIGLNNDKVTSVAGLVKALGASPEGWRLSFQREGQVYNLAIQG